MRGISWLAANRLASQEGLCCVQHVPNGGRYLGWHMLHLETLIIKTELWTTICVLSSHTNEDTEGTPTVYWCCVWPAIRRNVKSRHSAFPQGVCATSPVLPTADVAALQRQVPNHSREATRHEAGDCRTDMSRGDSDTIWHRNERPTAALRSNDTGENYARNISSK
jgi:hypothetical protein